MASSGLVLRWPTPRLLRLEQRVEMGVALIHAGRADRLGLLVGQLRGGEAATALPEAPEFLVFVRPHEIARDGPVARDRHRLALGKHAIAAEISGEFRSRDSVSHCHASFTQASTLAAFNRHRPEPGYRGDQLRVRFRNGGSGAPQARQHD